MRRIAATGRRNLKRSQFQRLLSAGRALARWAKQRRDGAVDEVIMLGRSVGGSVPQLRVLGMERGINEVIGDQNVRMVHLNGNGHGTTYSWLRSMTRAPSEHYAHLKKQA